ncbi:MAG: tRNA pseudouridine(55) synthase TruB [Gemmatimonadota bacterium]|nr:MAG: tRNA pseudouridine(55) synthase TruB [Gemmatimonadota bacterium]
MIDKPSGPTAHDVVAHVRRVLSVRRAGHAGTLDPFASGLLVLLVGRATRLSRFVAHLSKTYSGKVLLGETTDTGDLTGEVVESSDAWEDVTDDEIESAMGRLTGTLAQVPPSFSAKKVGGERAYRLARRGEAVELPPCEVQVYRFDLLGRSGRLIEFSCEVSSGTYVRALARDLGAGLGCGAHLHSLRRQTVGEFDVGRAESLDTVGAATTLRPALEAVSHLPAIEIEPDVQQKVWHGQPIPWSGSVVGPVALVADDRLLAVAEPKDGVLKPKVVLTG